jgi:hypothetical protein
LSDELRENLERYCEFVKALAGKMASWGLNWDMESGSVIWSEVVQVIKSKVDEIVDCGLKEAQVPKPSLSRESGLHGDVFDRLVNFDYFQ